VELVELELEGVERPVLVLVILIFWVQSVREIKKGSKIIWKKSGKIYPYA
jgi:hypothetical protein